MRKQLLLLLLVISITFSYSQELLIVDLTTENEVTITATTNASSATVSGSDTTGFYLENFFSNDATNQALTSTLVSGTLTSATETSDNSPSLFRGGGGSDPGLNIWSYTDDPNSNFTTGQQAFSGAGTWTLSPEVYNAMITAPTSGNIYFPADTFDDLGGATLIGTYSVVLPDLSIAEAKSMHFKYHPNPVRDIINISSHKTIIQVDIYNMLGQLTSSQKLNTLNVSVNTSSLATGTYLFQTTFQDNTIKTFKVIKEDF